MPTRLTLRTPTGVQVVDFEDDVLIMDCSGSFVKPTDLDFLYVASVTVDYEVTTFDRASITEALSQVTSCCWGVAYTNPVPTVTQPDPAIPTIPNPVPGDTCICFVTCNGTNLSFVKVVPVTNIP